MMNEMLKSKYKKNAHTHDEKKYKLTLTAMLPGAFFTCQLNTHSRTRTQIPHFHANLKSKSHSPDKPKEIIPKNWNICCFVFHTFSFNQRTQLLARNGYNHIWILLIQFSFRIFFYLNQSRQLHFLNPSSTAVQYEKWDYRFQFQAIASVPCKTPWYHRKKMETF